MDPTVQTFAIMANAGVAGIGLFLFIRGTILSKATQDANDAEREERDAAVRRLYEQAIADRDARIGEVKADRDEWKRLALGTERRLDVVTPLLAEAAGGPVGSAPSPLGGGQG